MADELPAEIQSWIGKERYPEKLVTHCAAKIALQIDDDDNPWKRKGKDWKP